MICSKRFVSLFKKSRTALGLFLLLGLAPTTFAGTGISSDLKSYFKDLGFASNATAPQAYQGQQAGYYTGGSFMARNTVRNVQIASVKLPSYQAGCSGIDLYGGAISFVSAEEMKAVLRSLMSSAGTFAFNLMLESTTPQIANTANRWHRQLVWLWVKRGTK